MATYTSGTYTLIGAVSAITAETLANQTVTYTIAGLADTFNITSDAGAVTTINQSVSVADTLNLVASGGSIVLGTGVAGVDSVHATITNGGSFIVGGTLASALTGSSFAFGTGGGSLVLGTAGTFASVTMGSQAISGFTGPADVLDDRALQFASITGYTVTGTGTGTQTVTVSDGSGNLTFTTSAANLANGTFTNANLNAGTLKFSADGNGGTTLAVCFLSGTKIATVDGETMVQDLRPGDLVMTRRDGAIALQPVSWVGHGSMAAARRTEDFPVRILAGAFGDDLPHRDLLLTSEHCLHVDGKLIPARMLVNGRSIIVDTDMPDYAYYHVELDTHAILLAEGLEAESYLDTGNRGNFLNSAVRNLRADFTIDDSNKSWVDDAAAPLAVDRQTVEPIWQKLDARASALGFASRAALPGTVNDPDLRLVTEGGLEIEPVLFDGTTYGFVVPGNVGAVFLRSRTFRPSDVVGPFLDDRRDLGVLVGRIGIGEGRRRETSTRHLTQAALPGWHGLDDQASCRWTSGDALLPADLIRSEGSSVSLDIEIVHAGPYRATALAA